jgi:hypothetical protein
MVSPVTRHSRRSQAEIPLIDLSEFPRPPLTANQRARDVVQKSIAKFLPNPPEIAMGEVLAEAK